MATSTVKLPHGITTCIAVTTKAGDDGERVIGVEAVLFFPCIEDQADPATVGRLVMAAFPFGGYVPPSKDTKPVEDATDEI